MASVRIRGLVWALLVWPLRAAWLASVVAIPAIAVWMASSLAAYRNGPVWLACACGLLLFPVAPLLWEAIAAGLRGRRARPSPRVLTFGDRLILRTLVINLGTLAALLLRFPETSFAALSTRGDWFLDGRTGPQVERVRAGLFFAADRVQWLYEAVHSNTFAQEAEDTRPPPPRPTPTPAPVPAPVVVPEPVPGDRPPAVPEATPVPATAPWPMAATLHPLVVGMPAEAEASIAAVGKYIAEREPDRRMRIKALHDYVADRVAYDAVALAEGRRPPQDAETVFTTHMGVCAGYANLLTALGDAAGEEIVVVVGDARTDGSDVTGQSHAWNAARIDDVWHLIDATWDAGSVAGRTYTKGYNTSYLFAPPEVFAVSHFPEQQNWQMLARPLTRGEFFRAPMLRGEFYAQGLTLVAPDRSQVSVDEVFDAVVKNPGGRFFMATYTSTEGSKGRCAVSNGATVTVRCELPAAGSYEVLLFSGPEEYGSYASVAGFAVNRG